MSSAQTHTDMAFNIQLVEPPTNMALLKLELFGAHVEFSLMATLPVQGCFRRKSSRPEPRFSIGDQGRPLGHVRRSEVTAQGAFGNRDRHPCAFVLVQISKPSVRSPEMSSWFPLVLPGQGPTRRGDSPVHTNQKGREGVIFL